MDTIEGSYLFITSGGLGGKQTLEKVQRVSV